MGRAAAPLARIDGCVNQAAVTQFLNTPQLDDIFDLGGVWSRAKRISRSRSIGSSALRRTSSSAFLKFVKDANSAATGETRRGHARIDLLKALLDRIGAGDPVPQNAETLIGGFHEAIGQEEVWANLKSRTRWPAPGRGSRARWRRARVRARDPRTLPQGVQSLELMDVVLVPRGVSRRLRRVRRFIGRFISWAGSAV